MRWTFFVSFGVTHALACVRATNETAQGRRWIVWPCWRVGGVLAVCAPYTLRPLACPDPATARSDSDEHGQPPGRARARAHARRRAGAARPQLARTRRWLSVQRTRYRFTLTPTHSRPSLTATNPSWRSGESTGTISISFVSVMREVLVPSKRPQARQNKPKVNV